MQPDRTERRLAAIMFTDIVGYTALMAESEAKGLRVRERHRALVRPLVDKYHGDAIEARGDESLAVFPTALDAVNCALAIEEALAGDSELRLHIGIHLGDFVVERGEVSGDAVNIAARIRAFAEAGVCVSGEVYHSVRNQPNVQAKSLGEHELRNVGRPVAVYALTGSPAAPRAAPALEPPAAPLTSIAVLPFDDMSSGGDQKWLADGMAEELIETLSRIEALRVPARTSAFALRGKDIRTVGAELRVGSVVEGSVRRSGDQLRITAQLIRVSDGSHLWSARYDRKLSDVFAIQTEIARAIAEAIRGELGIEYDASWLRSYEPSDVRAYELVKRGYDARLSLSEEGIRTAIAYYEQALAIDPDYVQAQAELGLAHLELWDLYSRADADLAVAKAQAERALARDATNGTAHNLLASILIRRCEWEEARRVVGRGLAHMPDHGGLRNSFAWLLAHEGRTAEALAEMRRAAEIDPRFWVFRWGLGRLHVFARQFDAAVLMLERARDLAPEAPLFRQPLAYAYHRSGKDEEALEAALRGLPAKRAALEAAMRQGFRDAGFGGAVRARHEWFVARSGKRLTDHPGVAAHDLAFLGEADAMFECLWEAIDRRDTVYLKADPVFDPYRDDPRFAALLRRMNLGE